MRHPTYGMMPRDSPLVSDVTFSQKVQPKQGGAMKHTGILVFLCLLAALAFSPLTLQAQQQVVTISSDPWKPWVMGTEGQAATGGLGVEVAVELFKRLKLPIDIQIYPYQRCLNQMKTGERDVLLMAKKTPEREKYMLYSDVAAVDPQVLIYSVEKMSSFDWKTWEDLKPYSFGIVRGFNYGGFTEAVEKHKIRAEAVSEDVQNIKKLMAGRIDFIIINISTARYYMDQDPEIRKKLRVVTKPVTTAEFHFALSKKERPPRI